MNAPSQETISYLVAIILCTLVYVLVASKHLSLSLSNILQVLPGLIYALTAIEKALQGLQGNGGPPAPTQVTVSHDNHTTTITAEPAATPPAPSTNHTTVLD